MSSESLKKFSEELKTHREKNDVSLQQIHGRTRIDIKFLKAMEEGNFDVLPDVYIRAFIKEYAKVIDMNPDEALRKYEKAVTGRYGVEDEVEEENAEVSEEKEAPKKLVYTSENLYNKEEQNNSNNKNVILGIAGVAAVIIIVLSYFLINSNSSKEIITESPYEEILDERENRFELKEDEPKPVIISDSLSLKIISVDTVWIRVTIDERTPQEYIMKPEREKIFKAGKEFYLYTGNAGGLEVFLNENKLEFDAPRGSVRNYKIDNNGIERIVSNSD